MDRDRLYYDLPPRSASMPAPGTVFPVGYFSPIPRKLSNRRDSEMVLSEGPITPPESPGPEEMATDPPLLQQMQVPYQQIQQPHLVPQPTQIVVEDRQIVNIDYPATPVSQPPETPVAMEEDAVHDEQAVNILRVPSRALSEENVEHDTGALRLTDFEVRGTLGMSQASLPSGLSLTSPV